MIIILDDPGKPYLSQWLYKSRKSRKVRVREGDVVMEAEVREKDIEDTTLLALKMEEGAVSQGMWAASRRRNRQGSRLYFRASRRNAPCQQLAFRISDF